MSYSIYHAINLLLLVAILIFVARKKLNALYRIQREDLERRLAAASDQFEKARALRDGLLAEAKDLETKLSEMRRNSLREIELESSKIQQESERQIQMAIADGEARVRNESEKLRSAMEQEILELSFGVARKALDVELKKQDAEWTAQMTATEISTGKKNYAS
jgi:F0F1-type ATP synthase membrane subunit b/b'